MVFHPMYPMFDPAKSLIDFVFTSIAVVFCFMIYHKTKELYELTRYQGIRYFREAFLFFGLSYIVRFLFSLVLVSREQFDLMLPRGMFIPLFIIPLGYLSTMAIFYLLLSLVWKQVDARSMIRWGHVVAIALPIIAFATRSHHLLLGLQSLLLVAALFFVFHLRRFSRRFTRVRVLYLLMFGLWLLSLWAVDPMPRASILVKVVLQLVSLIVFIAIYRKISKWTS